MLIGVKHRFVFIANTKTGSTSLERVLTQFAEINRVGSPQRKHIPWSEVLVEYDFLFGQRNHGPVKFFKFGVIREPLDWVRSWYNYRLGNDRVEDPIPSELSFADWWRAGNDWVRRIRQANLFQDGSGHCAMDLVLPYSQLEKAGPDILRRVGISAMPIPVENKSPGGLQLADIPAELAAEIRAHYRVDGDLHDQWLTKWEDAVSAPSSLVVVPIGAPQVAKAIIDQMPISAQPGDLIDLGGVVILKPEFGARYHLVVEGGEGVAEILSHIASPWYGNMFKGNELAAAARFKIIGLKIKPSSKARIVLVVAGTRHPIFELSM